MEGADFVVRERGVAVVEHLETDAVETGQAAVGAEPEVAVACLLQRTDAVVRQPFFDTPYVLHILRERTRGIESGGRGGKTQRGQDQGALHLIEVVRGLMGRGASASRTASG